MSSSVVGSLDHALAGIARLRRREEKENVIQRSARSSSHHHEFESPAMKRKGGPPNGSTKELIHGVVSSRCGRDSVTTANGKISAAAL